MSEVQKILVEAFDKGYEASRQVTGLADEHYIEHQTVTSKEAEQALYTLLMEKMPKKVSEDGLTDGQMGLRVGFNRGIDEMVSAINELFGRMG